MLVTALAVFSVVATLLWIGLGRPRLPGGGPLTTQDQLELVKIALAAVAGVGGVVYLVVAYRRQKVLEEENERARVTAERERTRLFNERFGTAAAHLGHDQAAVRIAGVYGLAGLADDAPSHALRQSCLSVLCAYLRLPHEVEPGSAGWRDGEREVRHAILGTIRAHLLPKGPLAAHLTGWHGHAFNFQGALFDGGRLDGIQVTDGTHLNFRSCRFVREPLSFDDARFTGGVVTLRPIELRDGGGLTFRGARFEGGTIDADPHIDLGTPNDAGT